MVPGIFQLVVRSVRFYKKPVIYQVLIIALLSAVITGSLLTGRSVRTSLKKSATERLGSTGIMISSGVRFFGSSLVDRISGSAKIECTGILELSGYSQSMNSQKGAFNTHIYAVDSDFFTFHANDSIDIKSGEIAINRRLADYLEVNPGDELIMRFNEISDIPADAPFAPSGETGESSTVMRIGTILEPSDRGNFSLSISQIMPLNIFVNLADFEEISGKPNKLNRILISNKNSFSPGMIYTRLKELLKPADVGLNLRLVNRTGGFELISDRVFIDDIIIREIENVLPASAPVITYLGNRVIAGTRSTPYSFVSALPSSIYPQITEGKDIIINRWMADDLYAKEGDTIEMFWYAPDSLDSLIESSTTFAIKRIVDIQGIWSDSLLMPDLSGIAGSESCSNWDAGIPIEMDEIRLKDEDYWNNYKGTPKAFINYEKGKEIWGNNYGPATSLRFPASVSEEEIMERLDGNLDPDKLGLSVTDLSGESIKAANESVDFSTLFLSLGFFLILASVVLLSFAISTYFDSKRGQINTLFALGFKNKWIEKLLFFESGLIAFFGSIIGAFAGYLVNIIITMALNSVWSGAVQTDTLEAFFSLIPILTGFIFAVVTSGLLIMVKIKQYLKKLNRKEKEIYEFHSPAKNFIYLLAAFVISVALFLLSFILKDKELSLSFGAGTMLLITLILFWRQYFLGLTASSPNIRKRRTELSGLYYRFYPSNGVTPILFIAAGIFAVFITGANRMNFDSSHLDRSGGTGGSLLWCENTIPVREDLNSVSGRKSAGLDEEQLSEMSFVQAKRSSGDDASCLNLNHITAPPLLGIDPVDFITKRSFSFSKFISHEDIENPWQFLSIPSENNTIYGIADQTVLQWGLMIKPGDTLILRGENGQPLNIIIAGGLKSSIFQGNVLIGLENFIKHFPSVSGSTVLLVQGDPSSVDIYKNILNDRFVNNGINIELTTDRLASFYEVTNTYLSVFGVFGAFGMITGIAGLGFVLLRNYSVRKREFSLLLATGFPVKKIRRLILSEQVLILFAGVTSGVLSAMIATFPSVTSSPNIPWLLLILMISGIFITGMTVLGFSVKTVTTESLTASLKKD